MQFLSGNGGTMERLKRAVYSVAFFALLLLCSVPGWAFQTHYTSFQPGIVWLANDSLPIDCHAGNIIYDAARQKYYWYGEHHGTPAGVACYSSTDLYNWVNEGVVLQKGTIQVCERPKVIYSASANKYIMWFHYDNSGYTLAQLGVATADSETGQFTLLNHFRPNGHQSRDMGMFTDTNGTTYVIYAADRINVTIRIVQLTSDYTNITTNDTNISAHCEGPGMCRYRDTCYLITSPCNGWTPGKPTCYTSAKVLNTFANSGDPCIGDSANTTFNSQPCFIFKIPGRVNAYMYMGDRWNGGGHSNSQYVFLPILFSAAGAMQLRYYASWTTSFFTPIAVLPGAQLHKPTSFCIGYNGILVMYALNGRLVRQISFAASAIKSDLSKSAQKSPARGAYYYCFLNGKKIMDKGKFVVN